MIQNNAGYPLPAYNFRVDVGNETMSFAKVSGIAVEYDAVTYRHGLSFREGERIKTFYYDSFMPLTLTRGVFPAGKHDPRFLFDWLERRDTRSLEVSLCDEGGKASITWKIAKAVPVKLKAPTFDAGSNEVSIESLELRVRGVSLKQVPDQKAANTGGTT